MRAPTDPTTQVRWLECVNGSASLTIPAFGLVRVTAASVEGVLTVDRPNSDGQYCLRNGPFDIPPLAAGVCTNDFPGYVLYETADGTPTNDQPWGAGNGSYKLRAAQTGYVIQGGVTLGRVYARVVISEELSRVVKVTSTTPVSGRYPGVLQSYDAVAQTYSDGAVIWIVDVNGSALVAERYLGLRSGSVAGVQVYLVDLGAVGYDTIKTGPNGTFGTTMPAEHILVFTSDADVWTLTDDPGNMHTMASLDVTPASTSLSVVGSARLLKTVSPLALDGTYGADLDLTQDREFSIAGLTTIGPANKYVGVNSGGTAWEYKDGSVITIMEEGGALTVRDKLNFIGASITAADNAGAMRTDMTLSQSPVASTSVVGIGRLLQGVTPLSLDGVFNGVADLSTDRFFGVGGLTTLGGSNQVVGVNVIATGWEYKTIAAGAGIQIDHAVGSITITNTLPRHIVQDEGVDLAQRARLNFIGPIVAATDNAGSGRTDVTIAYTVQEEGADLPVRAKLNFIGPAITAQDNAGANRTDMTLENPIAVIHGGTGLVTCERGDLLVGLLPDVYTLVPKPALTSPNRNYLQSDPDFLLGDPEWDKVHLQYGVQDVLQCDHGGTGFDFYMKGDLLVGNSAFCLSRVPIGGGCQYLTTSPRNADGFVDVGWDNLDMDCAGYGTLLALYGGTGHGANPVLPVAAGDLLVAPAAMPFLRWELLPVSVLSTRYLSNRGPSNFPTYSTVNMVNGVDGILRTVNGGTGVDFVSKGDLLVGSAPFGSWGILHAPITGLCGAFLTTDDNAPLGVVWDYCLDPPVPGPTPAELASGISWASRRGGKTGSSTLYNTSTDPQWIKITRGFASLAAASTTPTFSMYTLPIAGVIHAVKIKHSTAFSGGGVTSYKVSVGISGNNTKYHGLSNELAGAPSGTNMTIASTVGQEDHGATADIIVAVTCNVNTNLATAGSVDIWILVSTAP